MPPNLHGYKRILVYGGSFDPPHRAHVVLPQQAACAIGADVIAYIPAGRAPHKLDREQTNPQHRLAMLRLALDQATDQPTPTAILTDEIDRKSDEPSYTVDTLETLHQRIDAGATLRLLIGADQLRMFETWRDYERVIDLAEPVVMVRPPDTRQSLLDGLASDQRDIWAKRLVEVDQLPISSTQVREQAAAGQLDPQLIDGSVAKYINQHKLYQ